MESFNQFAEVVPEVHAVLIKPENLAKICDIAANLDAKKTPHAYEAATRIKNRQGDSFYKGSFEEVNADLDAGTLFDPPPEVAEIAANLAANISLPDGATRRRRKIDGDEGDLIINRYIDDRDDRLFRRRRRTWTEEKRIAIFGNFGFSGEMPIDRFFEAAAALVALADTFTRSGYACDIYAIDGAKFKPKTVFNCCQLAAAGTPLNISQVWTYTRPEISRRMYHLTECATCAYFGQPYEEDVNKCGLGWPFNPPAEQLQAAAHCSLVLSITTELITHAAGSVPRLCSALQGAIENITTSTQEQE